MNITSMFLAVCTASLSVMSPASPALEAVEPRITMECKTGCVSLTVEEYVAGVVAHEMPYTFEAEALKAQAVAARTYLYYCLENGGLYHSSADVCDDPTHCPGYVTEERLADRWGEEYAKAASKASRLAAEATEGIIATYEEQPLLALWHSSSHRTTENCSSVFLQDLPYLRSVSSPEDAAGSTASFTLTEVSRLLRGAGYRYNGGKSIAITNTPSGRCNTVTVGNVTLSGTAARRIFGLRSSSFTAEIFRGRLYFTVRGYGHGVGLSQYGANAMAKEGADFRRILAHYYTGSGIGSR